MKTKIVLAAAVMLFAGLQLKAQTFDAARVKILPGGKPGVVRVLYAMELHDPLTVKFYRGEFLMGKDKIRGGPYLKGVSKLYDLSSFDDGPYRIEVTSTGGSVTYIIEPTPGRKTFYATLESTFINHQYLVKVNN